jgi:deoxyribodipyrimidine photolyase-related protein
LVENDYASMNFSIIKKIPEWFWTGKTKMHCLRDTINQSLNYGYAHHIQRLMITGNFALLAGINPDELDAWYLGIYIAIEWLKLQIRVDESICRWWDCRDKPYVSSASYINKMSHYCGDCFMIKK